MHGDDSLECWDVFNPHRIVVKQLFDERTAIIAQQPRALHRLPLARQTKRVQDQPRVSSDALDPHTSSQPTQQMWETAWLMYQLDCVCGTLPPWHACSACSSRSLPTWADSGQEQPDTPS